MEKEVHADLINKKHFINIKPMSTLEFVKILINTLNQLSHFICFTERVTCNCNKQSNRFTFRLENGADKTKQKKQLMRKASNKETPIARIDVVVSLNCYRYDNQGVISIATDRCFDEERRFA